MNGLVFIDANFNTRFGEVDLIMQDIDSIVFIEVRMRNNRNFGSGFDSITTSKQNKIITVAQIYLQKHQQYNDLSIRFDAISVTKNVQKSNKYLFQWIQNAITID